MGLRDLVRRAAGTAQPAREPHLSFGSWDSFPDDSPRVVQICHPDWRGVKAAAYAFRAPVVEVDDLNRWGTELIAELRGHEVEVVVIQGWPPGSGKFAEDCTRSGQVVRCLLHSSPALQGDSPSEAAVISEVIDLRNAGVLDRVGTVKFGVSEVFSDIGHDISFVPNRAPSIERHQPVDLGPGTHIGLFGEPWWPKNIPTQALAATSVDDAVVHLTKSLLVDYLPERKLVIHGDLPRPEFLTLLGAMDLNLYATFTECHPVLPMESYLLGVPCLVSPNSLFFRDDPDLFRLAVVPFPDEPRAIARAIELALDNREFLVQRAIQWIGRADLASESAWHEFVKPRSKADS